MLAWPAAAGEKSLRQDQGKIFITKHLRFCMPKICRKVDVPDDFAAADLKLRCYEVATRFFR
jgi:hypothetical protein